MPTSVRINLTNYSNNTRDFATQIKNLDTVRIELFAEKIAKTLAKSLGTVAKTHIAHRVMEKSGVLEPSIEVLDHIVKLRKAQGRLEFFSKDSLEQFIQSINSPLQSVLAKSFSNPNKFLESGVLFQLSDEQPFGILKTIGEPMSSRMTMLVVPSQYYIFLKLDPSLSQEKSTLAFSLTETSRDVEFSKETFTIEELK